MKITALVLEDDNNMRSSFCDKLRELTRNSIHSWEFLEAADNDQAFYYIQKYKPDIAFLDVELDNKKTSFDLLKQLHKIDFFIIFVTAYNEYAIQAIRLSCIDYILKPVSDDTLKEALQKFILKKRDYEIMASNLMDILQNDIPRIVINTLEGSIILNIYEIVCLQADGHNTFFYMQDGKRHLSTKTMGSYSDLLKNFCRIHAKWFVNMSYVTGDTHLEKINLSVTIPKIGNSLPIANLRKQAVKKQLQQMHF